jgi:hypothetical protein
MIFCTNNPTQHHTTVLLQNPWYFYLFFENNLLYKMYIKRLEIVSNLCIIRKVNLFMNAINYR